MHLALKITVLDIVVFLALVYVGVNKYIAFLIVLLLTINRWIYKGKGPADSAFDSSQDITIPDNF